MCEGDVLEEVQVPDLQKSFYKYERRALKGGAKLRERKGVCIRIEGRREKREKREKESR